MWTGFVQAPDWDESRCSPVSCISVLLLLSGGHGRAAAGVYVEETHIGAAEAERSTTEAGLRGDHPAV